MPDLMTEADAEAADSLPATTAPATLSQATVRAGDLADRGLTSYLGSSQKVPAESVKAASDAGYSAATASSSPLPSLPSPGAPVAQPAAPSAPAAAAIPGLDGETTSAPASDPAADYATAREKAGQSLVDTHGKLSALGFQPSEDSLIEPGKLRAHVDASINAALADPAANENAKFGPSRFTPEAQKIRDNLEALRAQAGNVIGDHASALGALRTSAAAMQAAQTAAAAAATPVSAPVIPGLGVDAVQAAPVIPGMDTPPAAAIPGPAAGGAGAPPATAEDAILQPTAERHWTESQITAAKAGQKPYSIDAKGQFGLSESRPLESLTEAVRDGVIANPPAEVWKAAADKQALVEAAGSNPKIKAALAGAGRGAAFLATAPIGAGIGGAALSETGVGAPIGALVGGIISGSVGAWGYGKIVEALAAHNDTINSFVASQQLHPGYSALGELSTFGAGMPRALVKGAGEGLSRIADALASKSNVPGATTDAIRASINAADMAKKAGVSITPAVERDAYSRAASALDAIGKSYASSGGGLVQTVENFNSLAKVAAARGDSAGAIAAAIGKRVASGAAAMVAIDTVMKEGSKALGLSGEGQTLGGAGTALLLGAMASGHGIAPKGYDNTALGNLFIRGIAHDATGTAMGEKVDLAKLANLPGVLSHVTDEMTHPLTPEEHEIYDAFSKKALQLIGEGKIAADSGQWQANAQQILFAGRKGGIASVDIQPKERKVKGRTVGEEPPPVAPQSGETGLAQPGTGSTSGAPSVQPPLAQSGVLSPAPSDTLPSPPAGPPLQPPSAHVAPGVVSPANGQGGSSPSSTPVLPDKQEPGSGPFPEPLPEGVGAVTRIVRFPNGEHARVFPGKSITGRDVFYVQTEDEAARGIKGGQVNSLKDVASTLRSKARVKGGGVDGYFSDVFSGESTTEEPPTTAPETAPADAKAEELPPPTAESPETAEASDAGTAPLQPAAETSPLLTPDEVDRTARTLGLDSSEVTNASRLSLPELEAAARQAREAYDQAIAAGKNMSQIAGENLDTRAGLYANLYERAIQREREVSPTNVPVLEGQLSAAPAAQPISPGTAGEASGSGGNTGTRGAGSVPGELTQSGTDGLNAETQRRGGEAGEELTKPVQTADAQTSGAQTSAAIPGPEQPAAPSGEHRSVTVGDRVRPSDEIQSPQGAWSRVPRALVGSRYDGAAPLRRLASEGAMPTRPAAPVNPIPGIDNEPASNVISAHEHAIHPGTAGLVEPTGGGLRGDHRDLGDAGGGEAGDGREPGGLRGSGAPTQRSIDRIGSFLRRDGGHEAHLARLGASLRHVSPAAAPGGMAMTPKGELLYSSEAMQQRLKDLPSSQRVLSAQTLLSEELIHRAQGLLEGAKLKVANAKLWAALKRADPELSKLVTDAYRSAKTDPQKGAEFLRMLVQQRLGFPLTESFYRDTRALESALAKPQAPAVEALAEKVGQVLLQGKAHDFEEAPTAPVGKGRRPPTDHGSEPIPGLGELLGETPLEPDTLFADDPGAGREEEGGLTAPAPFKGDMRQQAAWMLSEARGRGFESVGEMATNAPDQFAQLATIWRARHPRKDGKFLQEIAAEAINRKLYGPSNSRGTAQNTLADAEQNLRGKDGAGGAFERGDGKAQRAEVVRWAKENGLLLDRIPFRINGPADVGGMEHHVFPVADRWVKVTRGTGESFGYTTKDGVIKPGTALDYLSRMRQSNEVLGDDIRLHGVWQDKHGNVNLVISQPDVSGHSPTAEAIRAHMEEAGFRSLGDSRFYRHGDNLLVADLHPGNAIEHQGALVPFDVHVLHPDAEQVKLLTEEDPDTLYADDPSAGREEEDEGAFYSQLTRMIAALPQETMTVGQARAAITKGAKPAEIAQQGILDDPLSPLAGKQPGDKVSKSDLIGYALERQATVQDVVLGESRDAQTAQAERGELEARIRSLNERMDAEEDAQKRVSISRERASAELELGAIDKPFTPTHFSQYQLPGADPGSYREMFVTWPGRDSSAADHAKTPEERERILRNVIEERLEAPEWRDGHHNYVKIANPIVRIRRNIRTDSEGRKTYFIEEMQGPSSAEQSKMPPELRKRIYEIGMKRAIRDAIDEGADAIGWTTGEQQAERYDLSKQITKIAWKHTAPPAGTPDFMKGQEFRLDVTDKSGELHSIEVDGKDVESHIGKELAEQIQKSVNAGQNTGNFSGLSLKVGGEGLKNLYDTMLPRIANKLAEKVGGKVGDGKIEFSNLSNDGTRIHSMPLPDAWKEEAPSFTLYADDPSAGPVVQDLEQGDVKQPGFADKARAMLQAAAAHSGWDSLVDDVQRALAPDARLTPEELDKVRRYGSLSSIPQARAASMMLDGMTAAMDRRKRQFQAALLGSKRLIDTLPSGLQRELTLQMDESGRENGQNIQHPTSNIAPTAPRASRKASAQHPMDDMIPGLETGSGAAMLHGDAARVAEVMGKIFPELRKLDAEKLDDVKAAFDKLGLTHWRNYENYLKNIIPHAFEDEAAANKVLDSMVRRRKIIGGTGWLKHREGFTLRDILERAREMGVNLKLRHENPVEAVMARWSQQDRFIGALQLMHDLEAAGLGHWETTEYSGREGERMINNIAGQRTKDIEGVPRKQNFWASDQVATLINNYLSRGLRQNRKWVEHYFTAANVLNGVQLGISAFHAGFVTMEGMVSELARGLQEMMGGEVGKGAKTALHAPVSTIGNYRFGRRVQQELLKPGMHPDLSKVVDEIVAAGFRHGVDSFYQDQHLEEFWKAAKALANGKPTLGLLRAPLALIEALAKPIMEHYVPNMKASAVYKLAEMHLRQNPNLSATALRKKLQESVRSGNNRFGQMTYDNLHLHKTVKDLLMMLTRSLGWNWGTFAEIGGGVADWVKYPAQWAKHWGEKAQRGAGGQKGAPPPEITNRMAYTLALPLLVGLFGAALSAMFGQRPKELKDYYFIKTGGTDEQGNPERIVLPSYMKDVFHAAREPGSTITNKLHPLLSTVAAMLENKDFYGVRIRNPGDPLYRQALSELGYFGKQFVPFTARNTQKALRQGSSPAVTVAGMLGISQAPAGATKTDAQYLADKLNAEKLPRGSRTQEQADHSTEKAHIIGLMRANPAKGMAAFQAAVAAGTLSPADLKTMQNRASLSKLQDSANRLSGEELARVYEVATPAEKRELQVIMDRKAGFAAKKAAQLARRPAGATGYVPR